MKKALAIILVGLVCLDIAGIIVTRQYTTQINQQNEPLPIQTVSQDDVKIAFIADQGLGTSSEAVLQLIEDEKTDIILHQGDFDYLNNPAAWDEQTTKILGADFPQIAVLGNHDMEKATEYKSAIASRLAKSALPITCNGTLGEQSTCQYKNIVIVSVTPGLVKNNAGSYINKAFASSTDTWKICSWHLNQRNFQVGNKKDEAGIEAYEACRKAGAMIVTGHEHSYSRTYLLDDVQKPHIASKSSNLALSPDRTFIVVSGIGGHSVRPQVLTAPWWASIYSASQNATFGALFCTFNFDNTDNTAHCYFKDINKRVVDSFDISR
jgi:predicted phosphodiesterase